ncbi:MAG TPA: diguanylate cyclase [Thermoleophilaceae bacterium]
MSPVTDTSTKTAVAVRIFRALTVAGLLGYAAHVGFGFGGSRLDGFFQDWVYDSLIFAAAASCFVKAATTRTARGRWLCLGFALLAFFAGELYYTLRLSRLENPPFPSLADAFYLAFYPLAYAGLVLFSPRESRRLRASLCLDGIVGALAVAALSSAVLLHPIIASTGGDKLAVATTVAYPVGDLLLLVFVVGLLALNGSEFTRSWAMLAAGLVLMAVADSGFLFESVNGTYVKGHLLDALWPAAALLLGHAAWQPSRRETVRLEGWRRLAMPALFALVPVGLLVYGNLRPMNNLALALAAASLVVAVARMALTFGENLRITASAQAAALTDALTGLGNRRKLVRDLEKELALTEPGDGRVLVLFDLDGFKHYNDSYGHPAGDALLIRLGRQLRNSVEGCGTAYRLGGDEFCAIVRADGECGHAVVAHANAALAERGEGFEVTSSHGAVVLHREAQEATEALQIADRRLYAEKGARQRSVAREQVRDVLLQVVVESEPELRTHIDDVAGLAHAVGRRLGLPSGELDDLVRAAEFHDIGKVAIPDAILHKPGPLDESEWSFMRQHTVIGERMLDVAPALATVAKLVRWSHERWDGAGYPDRLVGEEIPLGARIVSVCDAFHAMASDRPYSQSMKVDEAIAELRRCAGSQFDPTVVAAFCAEFEQSRRQPVMPRLVPIERSVAAVG